MSSAADPALVADAKRWQAIRKLPAKLDGKLMRMCVQALSEGGGDLPGDPYDLLPGQQRTTSLALAIRSGIERGYAYRVYRQWMSYDAAGDPWCNSQPNRSTYRIAGFRSSGAGRALSPPVH